MTVLPNKWYVPPPVFNGQVAPRHVLAVANDHVLFLDGQRKTKECTLKAFEAWCQKYSVEPAQ